MAIPSFQNLDIFISCNQDPKQLTISIMNSTPEDLTLQKIEFLVRYIDPDLEEKKMPSKPNLQERITPLKYSVLHQEDQTRLVKSGETWKKVYELSTIKGISALFPSKEFATSTHTIVCELLSNTTRKPYTSKSLVTLTPL